MEQQANIATPQADSSMITYIKAVWPEAVVGITLWYIGLLITEQSVYAEYVPGILGLLAIACAVQIAIRRQMAGNSPKQAAMYGLTIGVGIGLGVAIVGILHYGGGWEMLRLVRDPIVGGGIGMGLVYAVALLWNLRQKN